MKRRLNILTLLILFAFGLHIVFDIYFNMESFSAGFEEGYNEGRSLKGKKEASVSSHRDINLVKEENSEMPLDSLYNTTLGRWMPMQIQSVIVEIPEKDRTSKEVFLLIPITLGLLVTSICFIVYFLKLIIAVNASRIFDRVNISRLRKLGVTFICMGVLFSLGNYIDYYTSCSLINIPGYHLSAEDVFDFSYFIYALIAFLIAEIFAIGLRLQEEQELTI